MKSRHRAREIALQILYQYDLNHALLLQDTSRLLQHFEHFHVDETLQPFIESLVLTTLNHLQALDQILTQHASHWKISRMSSVDRSLLRMATCELTVLKEAPPSVIIDEAIELAKNFGSAETPAFINGILDSVLTTQNP